MLASTRSRIPSLAARITRSSSRTIASSPKRSAGENREQGNDPSPAKITPNVSKTNETAVSAFGAQDAALQESAAEGERQRQLQAPNRQGIWSRSQQPRERAMSGPRFEQTIIELQVSRAPSIRTQSLLGDNISKDIQLICLQPQPYAAIELIHKQPVRWTHDKIVECDGGGGPLGHPRIFINTDKPQINFCTYCGIPFVSIPCSMYCCTWTTGPTEIHLFKNMGTNGHCRPTSITENILSLFHQRHTP